MDKVQSLFSSKMFKIFPILIFGALVIIQAQDTTQKANYFQRLRDNVSEPPNIAIRLYSTYHKGVLEEGVYWKPFVSGGIQFDFPVYISGLALHINIDGGRINQANAHFADILQKNIEIINTSCSFSYNFPIYKNFLSIKPRIGLSNTIINRNEYSILDFGNHETKDLDNEFGFLGGLEPIVSFNQFRLALFVYGNLMFSSPYPFITANVTLSVGVAF